MRRLSVAAGLFFVLGMYASALHAADTLDLSIPLPLTGKQAKFGEIRFLP